MGMVNTPVYRTSTVVFDSMADYRASRKSKFDNVRYGRLGTYTAKELEKLVASIEGAYRAVLTPSGVSAIATTLNVLAQSGTHILVPDSVYFPCRNYCETILRDRGVDVEFYSGSDVVSKIRKNTSVVYCESPGSLTMEMQDIKAISETAHSMNAVVVADNTWATPIFFEPYKYGIDISIHAATKYMCGHSDVMMGTITTQDPDLWLKLRSEVASQGLVISPDDAYLVSRGIRSLAVRMHQHYMNGLQIAEWLEVHPKVANVYYPALASSPDHALWKMQMTGASGLMTIQLRTSKQQQRDQFIDGLSLFGIGASWGGFESLVLPVDLDGKRTNPKKHGLGQLVRLHVGLENITDLKNDLMQALDGIETD